jgi:hypothetical protein
MIAKGVPLGGISKQDALYARTEFDAGGQVI